MKVTCDPTQTLGEYFATVLCTTLPLFVYRYAYLSFALDFSIGLNYIYFFGL